MNDCYDLAHNNYPLLKQNKLFEAQNEWDKKVIENKKLPKFDLSVQATYQSDVVELPITLPPNIGEIESPNNDQYKALLTVNQMVYSGGIIETSMDVKDANLKVRKAETEVSLYQLKKKINRIYFSILLLQKKKPLLSAKKKLLNSKIKEVRSAIRNGVAIPNSDKLLEIEVLKTDQQFAEIEDNIKTLINTLSTLVGKDISTNVELQNPTIYFENNTEITRPELELFKLKKNQIDIAEQLIAKQNSPKVFAFATGGFGNPGLNMLDNSFQPFFIVGMKASWNIYDFKLSENKRKSLAINKDIIDSKEDVFRFNSKIEIDKSNREIEKLNALIASDKKIIEMRKIVLESLEAQLKSGEIKPSAYITELTNLFQTENSLKTYKIQILLAKANLQVTKGQNNSK